MGNHKILQDPTSEMGISRRRSPIKLRIHGENIFLSGRFHRWQCAVALGNDLDEMSVRMAVDVTSPDHLNHVDDTDEELLSFHSASVTPVTGNGSVSLARGELATPAGTRDFEMLLETPEGHTPFLGLSFVIRKDELGSAWKELVTGGSGAGGIDAERLLDPWSAVINPAIAAA
jgi:hypothetical protein